MYPFGCIFPPDSARLAWPLSGIALADGQRLFVAPTEGQLVRRPLALNPLAPIVSAQGSSPAVVR